MGKNYLFMLDLTNRRELAEKITGLFMKKAFLADATLFILADNNRNNYNFFVWTRRKVYSKTCDIQIIYTDQNDIEKIFAQMDFFISTGDSAEENFLKLAEKNNVNILNGTSNVETLFDDIILNDKQNKLKKLIEDKFKKDIFKKYPPKRWEYFLFHEGLGESIAFFFWLKKYREIHDKKILIICAEDIRVELMKYCPYADATLIVYTEIFDYISVYCTKKFDVKRVLHAHFLPKTLETKSKLSADEQKFYGIIGTIRDFLEIPPETKFEKYPFKIPKAAVTSAKNIFEKMNLTPGKVVFISVQGIYFSGLGHHFDFWKKIAAILKFHDYEIVTNSEKTMISGCRNIFLSLFESAAFAGLCGNMVSVPTGFFEAICALNTADKITWQIIYPNSQDIYWKNKGIDNPNVDRNIDHYNYYLSQYLSSNVEYSCCKWGNNSDEDDILINEIVNKIMR